VSDATVQAGDFVRVYDPSLGESERWYINDHTFLRDATGHWHLYGITHVEPAAPKDERCLAHATAPALRGPWRKQPFILEADPAQQESVLWAPHAIAHDGHYWMFYCGGGPQPGEFRIHLATSRDGYAWTRSSANPLVVDGFEARDPMVLRLADRWVMYYTATTRRDGGQFMVAAAESADLLHWTGRRPVFVDRCAGSYGGPCESPFVVARGGRYYLFIGPDWEGLMDSHRRTGRYDRASYRRTRVIESDDPFEFKIERQVATVDAHAAEVVVDEAGATWISHCGWGQGGVYLAPLHFE
jgi:beta-xylosidase